MIQGKAACIPLHVGALRSPDRTIWLFAKPDLAQSPRLFPPKGRSGRLSGPVALPPARQSTGQRITPAFSPSSGFGPRSERIWATDRPRTRIWL